MTETGKIQTILDEVANNTIVINKETVDDTIKTLTGFIIKLQQENVKIHEENSRLKKELVVYNPGKYITETLIS